MAKVRISILVCILTPVSITVPVVAIMAHNRAQICAPSCVCLFGVYVGLPWFAIPFPFLLPPYPTWTMPSSILRISALTRYLQVNNL